jgi:hypothetical protein
MVRYFTEAIFTSKNAVPAEEDDAAQTSIGGGTIEGALPPLRKQD